MRALSFLLILCAAFAANRDRAYAAPTAPPVIGWQRGFGGSGGDFVQAIQQTSDGGYFVAGYSGSSTPSGTKTNTGFGNFDYWVLRLNSNGDQIWEKSFGGVDSDVLTTAQQTSDGGYILGGYSESGISGNRMAASFGQRDYWVIKLDANGDKMWEKSYGGNAADLLFSLEQTVDGGYILGGYSISGVSGNKTSPNFGNTDYWVVKLNASGTKQWDKSFGGTGWDYLISIQQTTDGGYILGGFSDSGISGNKTSPNRGAEDCWVIKLDAAGNKMWENSYGGNREDLLRVIRQTADGGYVFSGSSESGATGNKSSPNYGSDDCWVVKLDSLGDISWDRDFGGNSDDESFALRQTSDGGFIVGACSFSGISGNKTSTGFGDTDCWVLKLDPNGNRIWEGCYGGTNSEVLYDIQETSDGTFILGAVSTSGKSGNKTTESFGDFDFWVVKLALLPVIVTQPQNQSVSVGQTVQFNSLAAGDPPPTYQWLFNGSIIPNATQSSLVVSNTVHTDAGLYSVIASNRWGMTTSAVARLTFNFLTLRMYAGITIDGDAGQTFQVQYFPVVGNQTNWQTLTNITLTNPPYLFIDVESPGVPYRFYRALPLP